MGFLDKVKNLFTEEVEEEEVVVKPKKEVVKPVEPALPKRETVVPKEPSIPVTESRLEENKEKFVFPVYFDDKDFDDLEKPKAKEKPKAVVPKEPKKEPYQGAKVTLEPEPKKVFKPSPIISPVYGVLDKNYSKDDITTKKDSARSIIRTSKPEHMTVDDIRNKAYGTLEDDLESTLSYDFSELEEKPKHEASNQEALDIFNELDFDTIEDSRENNFKEFEKNILLETEVEEVDDDTEELARQLEEQKKKLEEISQYMSENEVSTDKEIEVEPEVIEDVATEETVDKDKDLNDSELFDLIDSMYEKKEDDE